MPNSWGFTGHSQELLEETMWLGLGLTYCSFSSFHLKEYTGLFNIYKLYTDGIFGM